VVICPLTHLNTVLSALCASRQSNQNALEMARVSTLLLAGNTPANVRFTMKGFFMT